MTFPFRGGDFQLRHLGASVRLAASRVSLTLGRVLSIPLWPALWLFSALPDVHLSLPLSATVAVVVVSALRLSRRWCFGDGVYLRRRVLLLARIRAIVAQWEERCLREVDACCADVVEEAATYRVLSNVVGAAKAAVLIREWQELPALLPSASPAGEGSTSSSASTLYFHGITSTIAFSSEMPLEDMLEMAYTAPYVLHLQDDRQWLRRFLLIVQYVLLRRVALMEEAQFYRRLCRRVLFPRDASKASVEQHTVASGKTSIFSRAQPCTPVAAWRLQRRPTWLVPVATPTAFSAAFTRGSVAYLCLPLSYFPVETLLPYLAAETWMSDRLVNILVPQWEKTCRRDLRTWRPPLRLPRTRDARSQATESVGATQHRAAAAAACKVQFWFLRYTAPLLRKLRDDQRTAARNFCVCELYAATCPVKSSDGADHARHDSLQLLRDCAMACCYEVIHPGKPNTASPRSADPSRFSPNATCQAVRRALLLRAVSHGAVVLLQVCFPRLSLRYVTEVAAAGYGWTSSSFSSSSSPADASSSAVHELLCSLSRQMVLSIAAGVAEVLLKRVLGDQTSALSTLLSAAVTRRLQQCLLHVDEAFFRRWLRGEPDDRDGAVSPTTDRRTGSTGSHFARRPLTTDDVLSRGRHSGDRLLALHDAVVKWWWRVAVLGGRAVVTQQWRPLLGAALTAWVEVPAWTSAVSVKVGYSMPPDVSRLLGRREESLPTRSPTGLRLLLELLVEEQDGERDERKRQRRTARKALSSSPLRHPFLSLVVCASVWNFDHLLGESHRFQHSTAALYQHVQATRKLYTAVATYRYDALHPSLSARAVDGMTAWQEDVRCIAHYSVHQVEQTCQGRCGGTEAAAQRTARASLHPLLDTEESRLLQQPRALAYLPEHVDYFDLFSLPYRFILRQLGLEMVFAYRTAAGMQQESRQMAEEWWTQTLFNSAFNPLTSLLQEAVNMLASCASVLLFCAHWDAKGGAVLLTTTSLSRLLQETHVLETYRELLRGGLDLRRLEDAVCPVQQLCGCLPQTLWSEQAALVGDIVDAGKTEETHSGVSALHERRRQWRHFLALRRPELRFDAEDRIVGGLCLKEHGVQWHHVFFAYPQLFAKANAAVATLSDVSCACPPAGTVAVIGQSGAGKSTMNLLLRRLYDPVPVVVVHATHGGGGKEDGVDVQDLWRCSAAEAVLLEVLRLALVENLLPSPPSAARVFPSFADSGEEGGLNCSVVTSFRFDSLHLQPGYLSFDSIPLAVFSSEYVKQWLAWLPQSPTVFAQHSFLQNVCATTPWVTVEDVQEALRMCQCEEMLQRRRCALTDPACQLSGGEGQRLALARVVVSVRARCRLEVLLDTSLEPEDTGGLDATSSTAWGGLVLDEPTSRLDALNEQRLTEALAAIQSGAAGTDTAGGALTPSRLPPLFIWIVSHRMSSLRGATHMVVVEAGTVTACGPASEVLHGNAFATAQLEHQRLPAV